MRQLTAVLNPSFGQVSSLGAQSSPELLVDALDAAGGSGVLLDVPVHRITPLKALLGRLVLTPSTLLFLPCPESMGADEHGWLASESDERDFYWMWFLSELTSVRLKRQVHGLACNLVVKYGSAFPQIVSEMQSKAVVLGRERSVIAENCFGS